MRARGASSLQGVPRRSKQAATARCSVAPSNENAPASAQTSFFIVTGQASSLDHKYTAFGRVVEGMEVVKAIEAVPTDGDEPLGRVELSRVRVERVSP